MNRLWQLEQTLLENLKTISEHPGTELVLLNLNSQDNLDGWVRQHGTPWIEKGVLVYVQEFEEKYFHMSRAKNLSHKPASGTVLFNLDCDNYIGETLPVIKSIYRKHMDTVLHFHSGLWRGKYFDGTYGRVALPKRIFDKIGGYDESFYPVGWQDADIIKRACKAGCVSKTITDPTINCVGNSKDETVRYIGETGLTWEEMNNLNREKGLANIASGNIVANVGLPKTRLLKNWSEEICV
jgi:hypothetical protein